MQSSRVNVGVVATLLADQGGKIAALSVLVQNTGAVTLYVGGADVTVGNGYEIPAGAEDSFTLAHGEKLYGIVAAGSVNVEVLAGGR